MKIAIVHYWLTNLAGGERALLEIHKAFPDAPIYTSVYDPRAFPEFKGADIRTTWLQKFPFKFKHQFFAPLRPFAFRSLDLSEYDVVLINESADAKNIRVSAGAKTLCYCHTPIRYYWSDYQKFLDNPGFGALDPVARLALKVLVRPLRKIDYKAAQRMDYFAGNSEHIVRRIKKYYDRDAEVLYPPVNVHRFKPTKTVKKEQYVHIGRMNTMKRIDLIVKACNELKVPLTVAGRGTEYERLKKLAGPTVEVIFSPSDEEVTRLFQEAKALIFAAEEDFGITPVEAMSAGTPVIAYGKAGVLETLTDKTGVFFEEQSVESIVKAIQKFEKKTYKKKDLLDQAAKFSEEAFARNLKAFVESKTSE